MKSNKEKIVELWGRRFGEVGNRYNDENSSYRERKDAFHAKRFYCNMIKIIKSSNIGDVKRKLEGDIDAVNVCIMDLKFSGQDGGTSRAHAKRLKVCLNDIKELDDE